MTTRVVAAEGVTEKSFAASKKNLHFLVYLE